jgi:hypothetical protein
VSPEIAYSIAWWSPCCEEASTVVENAGRVFTTVLRAAKRRRTRCWRVAKRRRQHVQAASMRRHSGHSAVGSNATIHVRHVQRSDRLYVSKLRRPMEQAASLISTRPASRAGASSRAPARPSQRSRRQVERDAQDIDGRDVVSAAGTATARATVLAERLRAPLERDSAVPS